MSTDHDTETDATTGTGDVWPPLAHIHKGPRPPKAGDRALCGAKLMGIDLDGCECSKVCAKCVEIARAGG